uniref:Uncharacterized protein n=1 Tax=Arundo donax TaxID=35708 RepID=A0A0A8YA26_ARUDO
MLMAHSVFKVYQLFPPVNLK